MNSLTEATTLYENWQKRRQHLLGLAEAQSPRNISHVKVLEYLIHRYRDSNEAHRGARFGFRSDLVWNDRRIVVHHHLGRGQVAGVESKVDAESRVASIVRRMVSGVTEKGKDFNPAKSGEPVALPAHVPSVWRSIKRGLKWGWNVDRRILWALEMCPYLPREAVQHLFTRVANGSCEDTFACRLLLYCRNESVLGYGVQAWRERVANGHSTDRITKQLEAYFRQPNERERAAEKIREQLADEERLVRLAATFVLATFGDLDDTGLLSDLLALPASGGVDECERDALLRAMKSIAGQNLS